jgi:hypothetical protein
VDLVRQGEPPAPREGKTHVPDPIEAGELQTKLQQTLEAAQTRQANGQDVGALRQRAEQLHQENLAAQRELRLAQDRLKSLPRTAEVPAVTATPEVTGTSVESAETRSGRASGPKIEGDSGVRNWTIQEAGQKHQMPEAILDMATDKTKESPTGGKALINKDLENLEKIKQIGGGDFRLTEPKPGQLMVPGSEASRLESELAEARALIDEAEKAINKSMGCGIGSEAFQICEKVLDKIKAWRAVKENLTTEFTREGERR